MRAYILCGGFGTRLSSVLQGSQKAVVDVHGRPFLELVLQQLKLAGLSEAVLCAHYRADQLDQLLPALAAQSGLKLRLVIEEQPMGTGAQYCMRCTRCGLRGAIWCSTPIRTLISRLTAWPLVRQRTACLG